MRSPTIATLLVIVSCTLAQEQHYIDVRELVRDTIDAIKEVPAMIDAKNNTNVTPITTTTITPNTNDVYQSLLKLPADIMSRLALDAGFVDPRTTTTNAPTNIDTNTPMAEEGRSFRTVDDERDEIERETPKLARPVTHSDDVFSISRLISATGNALRAAQQQQDTVTMPPLVPLPTPLETPRSQALTEVVYRPIVKNGKTVYEQLVLLKMGDGSSKVISQNLFETLPMAEEKRIEIKQVDTLSKEKAAEFAMPTFPPMVNVFPLPDATTIATTTTTSTSDEVVKSRKSRVLPRRTILEKKPIDMHSRQFGAKTLQMNDPIEIREDERQHVEREEPAPRRIRTLHRRRLVRRRPRFYRASKEDVAENESPTTTTTTTIAPTTVVNKRRRLVKKVSRKSEVRKTKEIRKFPQLYDEQWKTQVAPSVSPPSEDFVAEFGDMQQDEAMGGDELEARGAKVTQERVEEMLDREIRRRVLMKIQSARTKGESEEEEELTTTTTNVTPRKRAVVTRQQCLNLRSFAKQFLFDNLEDFAKEHCSFIENYYPDLKCSRVDKYVKKCIRLMTKSE